MSSNFPNTIDDNCETLTFRKWLTVEIARAEKESALYPVGTFKRLFSVPLIARAFALRQAEEIYMAEIAKDKKLKAD
jgi:hypothetical protein